MTEHECRGADGSCPLPIAVKVVEAGVGRGLARARDALRGEG